MHGWTAAASFGRSDCELIDDALLAQPVLALTSLTYVAVGIFVLCWAMRGRALLTGTAGVALVGVGVGSFVFHGPQPPWAGPVHDWPIVALAGVCVIGVARGARGQRSAWVAAAAIFALGLAAYAAGRTGSPLCRPDSLWQYHGVWHVLSGAAGGLAAWAMMPTPQYRSPGCR
ncbi:hypothetical protein AU193_20830 [Mycobacterium sp. GA-1285]|uniref:hypothetical protein n=1 Tax=Mycobacterium sp. GA-1285 TaxID=1772282 RepID=UPI0007494273|nr:hypothetical protein [Mycobacterium sp. GA-1285]KUI22634.1 hypothetical protein AU193_20830 [Mycobacterium sp. GA-1285]